MQSSSLSPDFLSHLRMPSHIPVSNMAKFLMNRGDLASAHEAVGTDNLDDFLTHLGTLQIISDVISNAPIHRVPEEILGIIFNLCVPGLRIKPTGPAFSPVAAGDPHPHNVRLYLCQVCRTWTRVMYCTPRVWTTVALDRRLPPNLEIVRSYLRRSKSCFLDLYINTSRWFQDSITRLQAFFEILRSEVPRLRHFVAFRPRLEMLSGIFPAGTSIFAPYLEVFQIRTRDPAWNSESGRTELGAVQTPSLNILDVSNSRILSMFLRTPLQQLRRLHILSTSEISLPHFLQFLLGCSAVQELFLPLFEDWNVDEPHVSWPLERVSLFSLKELRFSIHDSLCSIRLCQTLHLPALELLDVVAGVSATTVYRLDPFLNDSAGSLRHLCIRGPLNGDISASFTGSGVVEFLYKLTKLEVIRLDWVTLGESFFLALAPGPMLPLKSRLYPWPRLRLEFRDTLFDGDHLLRLIRSRTDLEGVEESQTFVTALSLDSCPGLKPHHMSELHEIQGRAHSQMFKLL
ncbi:hypothetical protein K439DRAFT_1045192 [Ramaria rubella]|nr:hypothetical protein K439DRAFT_1045192 [Ramaria rubella]